MKWHDTIVCWNTVDYIPRHVAIWRFVSKGLYPFIQSNGYVIKGDVKTFSAVITKLFYMNRGVSSILAPMRLTPSENDKHDKIHFYHVLSQDKWDSFWDIWSLWSDLTDWRGEDRRIDIQEYCWSQIDLDESPQTRVVDELLSYPEETGNTGKADDVYLREAAESNEWGGFR